ncbi:BAM_G0025430.mRNA.1.CDS.1 [Saccharomyces cerevisiae]|nr:BAM_G0025430.mRNA.1.CDS.1 [Saccharomyces cerevisiae]CAI7109501.1 BAM_G0025430.mRNA.1.CDS.1 [Saccharomyces cerevisiae]
MLNDFCCSYMAGTHGRERAPPFTGTFVSHVSAENNCRPRRSEIRQPCPSGTERSISRLRRNSALSLSRVATEISCLFH